MSSDNQKKPLTDRERRALRQKRKREQERRRFFTILAIAVVLLGVLIFGIASCVNGRKKNTETVNPVFNGQSAPSGTTQDNVVGFVPVNADPASAENAGAAGTASPTPVDQTPVTITVSLAGDCTLGTDEYFDYSTSLNNYCETYGTAYFMENVLDIFSSDDLTISNMESVFTDNDYLPREDKQFAFKAPTYFAQILPDGNIEAMNTANNHSMDYGYDSRLDTLEALDNVGVIHFGYDEVQVIDVKGVKVGLVGIYELDDHDERIPQLKNNIKRVKEQGAVLTIVVFHWGNELDEAPDEYQTLLGRMAIDEGADLVVGSHAHIVQGIETYKGKNIVYGLGNFCFGGNSYPREMDTFIYRQTFTVVGNKVMDGVDASVIPCSVSSDYYYNNYQPTPQYGESGAAIIDKIQQRTYYIPLTEDSEYFDVEGNALYW